MSDAPQGRQWWRAVDGKWYPPERWSGPEGTEPPDNGMFARAEEPPALPPVEGSVRPVREVAPVSVDSVSEGRRAWYVRWPAVVLAALLLFGAGVLTGRLTIDQSDEVVTSARASTTSTSSTTTTPTPTTTVLKFAISGSMVVLPRTARSVTYDYETEDYKNSDNPECFSDEGYDDIAVGTSITVYDGNSVVIGTGQIGSVEWGGLEESRTEGIDSANPGSTHVFGSCLYKFTVGDLPASDFYALEVGRRGKITYSMSDLEAQGWDVVLSLS